jgi:hypothetical protein
MGSGEQVKRKKQRPGEGAGNLACCSPAVTCSPVLLLWVALAALALPAACSWRLDSDNVRIRSGAAGPEAGWRCGVLATCFWVGEPGNEQSAWDGRWVRSFGGVDDPARRAGLLPAGFAPLQNPFYCALPYNDVAGRPGARSELKDRWVEVRAGGKNCFCQVEDVGPWRTDDREYVFGAARPKAEAEGKAGIDLSPAACGYLGIAGKGTVAWRFAEAGRVPAGPWRQVITGSGPGTSGREE